MDEDIDGKRTWKEEDMEEDVKGTGQERKKTENEEDAKWRRLEGKRTLKEET